MEQKNTGVPEWSWLIEESKTARQTLLASSDYPDAERIAQEIVEVPARLLRRCLKKARRNASTRSKERLLAEANRVKERIEKGLQSHWWMCAPYLSPFIDQDDSHVFDQRMPQIVERMRQVIVEEEKRLFPRDEPVSPTMIPGAAAEPQSKEVADNTPTLVKTKRGRPQTIPNERKEAAAKLKASGGTNKQVAAKIYDTKRPTEQQIKNVPTILRHYQAKSNPPLNPRKSPPNPRKTRG
jgi:hypothetical protein